MNDLVVGLESGTGESSANPSARWCAGEDVYARIRASATNLGEEFCTSRGGFPEGEPFASRDARKVLLSRW